MKTVTIPEIGEVDLIKHANARSLRITVGQGGKVRVTIPRWAPYQSGVAFAIAKKSWILANQETEAALPHGFAVGKFHHLYFQAKADVSSISTRQKGSELWVTYPETYSRTDTEVQKAARKLAIRALRKQAESLLPGRLAELGNKHGFTYSSVEVRQLKARWGSCSSKQEITLNLFLMQLPWDLIDYVLIHELVHTKALHHGPDFWALFETALPGAKKKRTQLRNHQPNFG